jgi:hypothetical protein
MTRALKKSGMLFQARETLKEERKEERKVCKKLCVKASRAW